MPRIVSTPVPRDERRFVLAARAGRRPAGRLRGRILSPGLFYADRFRLEDGADVHAVLAAFAAAVAAYFDPGGGEVLTWMDEKNASWRAALAAAGFHLARQKAFVERDLTARLPPKPAALRLLSLADVGQETFLGRMVAASAGDPFEEHKGADRDVAREWRELVEYAGERFDPTRWWLVDDAQGPVGVVLPQTTSEDTGTVFYVGVLPARRGTGLGVQLHALGLHRLAEQGACKYVGSTDLRNGPMRRVFERNGCRVTGTQGFFVLAPRPSSAGHRRPP